MRNYGSFCEWNGKGPPRFTALSKGYSHGSLAMRTRVTNVYTAVHDGIFTEIETSAISRP
jgi:hypothetical protein